MEDEAPMRKLLAKILTDEGFIVETAISGEEGLVLAEVSHPKIILLDLLLPKMAGIEMLQRLYPEPWIQNTTIFVLSNTDDQRLEKRAKKYGAKRCINKLNMKLADLIQEVHDSCSN